MTKDIEAQLKAAIGDQEIDVSKLTVFEARTITTEPVTTSQLFYNGAKFTVSTLREMADHVNQPGNAVPLQIMHNTDELPVGRVFAGSVHQMPNGEYELRTMFYLPKDKTNLISDIENSIIDEVSVGAMPDHAFCSKCNFDFVGPDATFLQRITGECENGHIMGQDGAYAQLVGLSGWKELSLVNRGAARQAKILSRAKQSMSKETSNRLAASGTALETVLLTATYKMDNIENNTNKGDIEMSELKELLATLTTNITELTAVKSELKTTQDSITAKDTAIADLTAANKALETENAELKAAQSNDVDKASVLAQAKEAETKLKDAADKMRPHVEAALVASGGTSADLKEDMDLTAMLTLIEEKGLKLHQAVQAKSDDKDDQLKAGMSDKYNLAFKTRK